ncbi:PREDICTED: uncharacterized protein LOC106741215 [Dinoponera quadriceps]|uniref:Uncharacterized protein LOC106741215 n=1 Tax=Dinoponera quadriceps TaxID=609295 RepID=A0A6P3WR03_DINQU|nr:PREDICTED: uncharacterized protein LOC106741215 [Dinoponera quadriceps]
MPVQTVSLLTGKAGCTQLPAVFIVFVQFVHTREERNRTRSCSLLLAVDKTGAKTFQNLPNFCPRRSIELGGKTTRSSPHKNNFVNHYCACTCVRIRVSKSANHSTIASSDSGVGEGGALHYSKSPPTFPCPRDPISVANFPIALYTFVVKIFPVFFVFFLSLRPSIRDRALSRRRSASQRFKFIQEIGVTHQRHRAARRGSSVRPKIHIAIVAAAQTASYRVYSRRLVSRRGNFAMRVINGAVCYQDVPSAKPVRRSEILRLSSPAIVLSSCCRNETFILTHSLSCAERTTTARDNACRIRVT